MEGKEKYVLLKLEWHFSGHLDFRPAVYQFITSLRARVCQYTQHQVIYQFLFYCLYSDVQYSLLRFDVIRLIVVACENSFGITLCRTFGVFSITNPFSNSMCRVQ